MRHIVWCWKGDYWNLGAGAEIGIYYTDCSLKSALGYYDIDKDNLKVKVHMKVDYNGDAVEIQQTNWWITLFRPKYQSINIEDLTVWQAVSFDIPYGKCDASGNPYIMNYSIHDNKDLFDGLRYNETLNYKMNNGYETNLKWGPTPPILNGWSYLNLNEDYYGSFQFYIKY